jgi:sugar lactone lactonase YvrE
VLTFLYNVIGYEISIVNTSKVFNSGPQALTLLEGPHWSTEKQELVYVDIENHRVHRYVPSTNRFYTVEINAGRVSLVVPIRNEPNKYIIGVERNLMIMEWDGESSVPTSLTTHKPLNAEGSPRSRLNDGKCDPSGIRLWAGTMDESGTSNGNLYKLESSGNLSAWINGVGTSNGLAWSLDNRTMYYIDTNTGKVDAFDYDFNQGSIANRRTIFDVWGSGVGGSPDGMTIDSSGNLWVATWGGSKVLNINPRDRTLIGTVDFSGLASQITSAAFGGPNLDILYVTSADSGNPDESAGGSLFEVKNVGATGVRGGVSFCLTENCA